MCKVAWELPGYQLPADPAKSPYIMEVLGVLSQLIARPPCSERFTSRSSPVICDVIMR